MNKLSKGTLLLAIGVFALGAASGAGATYLAVGDDKGSNATNNQTSQANNEGKEVEQPTEPDSSLPQGTVSPTEVVNNSKNYIGKEVTLHGMLIQLPEGKYLLSGKEPKESKSIAITISDQNIKVNEFVSVVAEADPKNPKGTFEPVSAKGTVTEDQGQLKFTATSLSK